MAHTRARMPSLLTRTMPVPATMGGRAYFHWTEVMVLSLALAAASRAAPVGAEVARAPGAPGYRAGEGARLDAPALPATPAPLSFEPNRGQAPEGVDYIAHGPGYTVHLTPRGAAFSMASPNPAKRARLRMTLLGTRSNAALRGLAPLPGRSNYYFLQSSGRRPEARAGLHPLTPEVRRACTDIPHYAKVRCPGVYPGIDAVYYGSDRCMEYDFVISPGGDPRAIRLLFDGAQDIRVNAAGDLILRTDAGTLVEHAPVVYQDADGGRRAIHGRYVRRGAREVGFEVGAYDRRQRLTIDPVLTYSTFLGGNGWDQGNGVAVDSKGNILLAGTARSTDFPLKGSISTGLYGSSDVFVTKFQPDGQDIVYSTYFSGGGADEGNDIAVDAQGNAYVTGSYEVGDTAGIDVLAFKLGPDGKLAWGATWGGTGKDVGNAIALDKDGYPYITGDTDSWDYDGTPDVDEGYPVWPKPGAFQTTRLGSGDAFVTKIDPKGTLLIYSTYLGGDANLFVERGMDIAVDAAGHAFVVGQAAPGFWITTDSYQTSYGGGLYDGFLTEFNADGTDLVYSTLIGGEDFDHATGVALDRDGKAYVTGVTYSAHFPHTAGAFQADLTMGNCNPDVFPYEQCSDSFVCKFDTTRTGAASLVYSTYLGAIKEDDAYRIAVDGAGNAYVTGRLLEVDFPLKDALPTKGLGFDAFVTVLNPTGSDLVFSTFFGGSGFDVAHDITLGPDGSIYIAGETQSDKDFPVQGAYQANGHANGDAFVARIGMAAAPKPGDVDGNGEVDLRDVRAGLRLAAGLEAADAATVARGDMAGPDGAVTLSDALTIARRLAGLS